MVGSSAQKGSPKHRPLPKRAHHLASAYDFLEKRHGMDDGGTERLTDILGGVRVGREDARERLVRTIYGEMRRMAGGLMRLEPPGHTLQPSALVHEALLRLLYGEIPFDA